MTEYLDFQQPIAHFSQLQLRELQNRGTGYISCIPHSIVFIAGLIACLFFLLACSQCQVHGVSWSPLFQY